MLSLLTLFVPGIGQFTAGDSRKAAKMFLGAFLGLPFTGGLSWIGCGIWSFLDYQKLAPAPAAPVQAAGSGAAPQVVTVVQPPAQGAGPLRWTVLALASALVLYLVLSGTPVDRISVLGLFDISFAR